MGSIVSLPPKKSNFSNDWKVGKLNKITKNNEVRSKKYHGNAVINDNNRVNTGYSSRSDDADSGRGSKRSKHEERSRPTLNYGHKSNHGSDGNGGHLKEPNNHEELRKVKSSSLNRSIVMMTSLLYHRCHILDFHVNIENKNVILVEKTSVLKYKTPHFKASATIEVPSISNGKQLLVGWIQVVSNMTFVNVYGKYGLTSWEFPEMTTGHKSMISDSDGRCFPWYGARKELTRIRGPTHSTNNLKILMNDNFSPQVTWYIPAPHPKNVPRDPRLTKVHRKQSFITCLAVALVDDDDDDGGSDGEYNSNKYCRDMTDLNINGNNENQDGCTHLDKNRNQPRYQNRNFLANNNNNSSSYYDSNDKFFNCDELPFSSPLSNISILRAIKWWMDVEIEVDPSKEIGERATISDKPAFPDCPAIITDVDQLANIITPSSLSPPNANKSQTLVWRPFTSTPSSSSSSSSVSAAVAASTAATNVTLTSSASCLSSFSSSSSSPSPPLSTSSSSSFLKSASSSSSSSSPTHCEMNNKPAAPLTLLAIATSINKCQITSPPSSAPPSSSSSTTNNKFHLNTTSTTTQPTPPYTPPPPMVVVKPSVASLDVTSYMQITSSYGDSLLNKYKYDDHHLRDKS